MEKSTLATVLSFPKKLGSKDKARREIVLEMVPGPITFNHTLVGEVVGGVFVGV